MNPSPPRAGASPGSAAARCLSPHLSWKLRSCSGTSRLRSTGRRDDRRLYGLSIPEPDEEPPEPDEEPPEPDEEPPEPDELPYGLSIPEPPEPPDEEPPEPPDEEPPEPPEPDEP